MAKRGLIKVDHYTYEDGVKVPIHLDKETGRFSAYGFDKRPHAADTLPKLKEALGKSYREAMEGEYDLVILVEGTSPNGGWPDFSLDRFSFKALMRRPTGEGKWIYKQAHFEGPDKFHGFTPVENPTKVTPTGTASGPWRGEKVIPYTWARWQALKKVEEGLRDLRHRLGKLFIAGDLEAILDAAGERPLLEAPKEEENGDAR